MFHQSRDFFRAEVKLRYCPIEEGEARFPVKRLCRIRQVSRSGFYCWARRGVRDPEREHLIERVFCTMGKNHKSKPYPASSTPTVTH